MNINQFKEALFARGAALGFADMEIFYQSNAKFTARVFKGEVDNYSIAVEGGLSFRGMYGGNMGYAYTELIDESSLEMLLENAMAGAGVRTSEEREPMCEGGRAYQPLDTFSEALEAVTPDQKLAAVKELEAECLRLDPRVTMVNYCTFQSGSGEQVIANTRGLDVRSAANHAVLYTMVVVKEGADTKTAFDVVVGRDITKFDGKALAAKIVGEAISYLGAEPVESKTYPVLLRNTAAASLLSTFVEGFFATNVQKGKSRLAGKLAQPVAAPCVTMIDDPLRPDGPASRPFDHEGVPSQRLTVVEQGVLKSFLHNLKSAGVDGVPSTGHGYKASYKSPVSIAPSNLYIEPGTDSFEALVETLAEGVIITDLQGLHSGANPISGDFSLAAEGYLVQGGKVIRPVNQITVAGNFYELLASVEAVGSDLRSGMAPVGDIASPTLKIKSLAITGK